MQDLKVFWVLVQFDTRFRLLQEWCWGFGRRFERIDPPESGIKRMDSCWFWAKYKELK
jgi:hypothetical protein